MGYHINLRNKTVCSIAAGARGGGSARRSRISRGRATGTAAVNYSVNGRLRAGLPVSNVLAGRPLVNPRRRSSAVYPRSYATAAAGSTHERKHATVAAIAKLRDATGRAATLCVRWVERDGGACLLPLCAVSGRSLVRPLSQQSLSLTSSTISRVSSVREKSVVVSGTVSVIAAMSPAAVREKEKDS